MRELQFPVAWKAGGGGRLLVSVHTGPSHTAQEFIADAFITQPVGILLDLIAEWKGLKDRFSARAAAKRLLVFDIAPDLVDRPWQVASILATIESAVFLQDLDDDPFITGVSVEGASFAEATTEGCFADMERFARFCAADLTGLIRSESMVEGEPLAEWPRRAERYMFDIRIPLAAALGHDVEARLRTVFEQIEVSIAGSAFETERSMEDLMDEGLVPFPVKFEVSSHEVQIAMESPPSDIAIPLVLLRDIARKRLHIDAECDVRIAEAW